MPPAIIAWISLGLSVASFAVFAILALRKPPAPPPPERNPADAQPQGMAMPQVGEVADLAEKLGKAGPSATAASLSIFFLVVALIAGGIVEIAVDTAASEAAATGGDS